MKVQLSALSKLDSDKTHRLLWVNTGHLDSTLPSAQFLDTTSELRSRNWQVTLLSAGFKGRKSFRGIEVTGIKTSDIYLFRQFEFHLKVYRHLYRQKFAYDVILFHFLSGLWLLPILLLRDLRKTRQPYIVMDTRDIPREILGFKERLRKAYFKFTQYLMNKFCDGQTAITPRMASLLAIPASSLLGTWPSGVDLERFALARSSRRWPSNGESVQLIYVGSLSKDRHLMTICEAVVKANREGMDFALTILGKGVDSALLEEFAKRAGQRIRVLPPVPHESIPDFLAKAHVGVTGITSEKDVIFQVSSPIKVFEYMASGLPILASKNACYTDVIGEKPFAYWAEPSDISGFVEALRRIWSQRQLLQEKGEEAASAAAEWTWRQSALKLRQALEHMLEFNSGGHGKRDYGESSFSVLKKGID